MSTGLLEQLADYGAYLDDVQGSIEAGDILQGTRSDLVLADNLVRRPRSTRVGLLTAAAASLTVLLLVGGAVLLTRWSVEDQPPVTEVTVTETTFSTPTTNPTPSTTLPGTGFAPRLEGSGVDVTFGVTPIEMTMSGGSFVLLEVGWSIDWEGLAWEWGDDEIRQRIAASERGHNTNWIAGTNTLLFQDNSDKGPNEGVFARFALTFSGTTHNFEIQVREASSRDLLGTVSGSLPGLDEEQILSRVAETSSRSGWFFASENGELQALDAPWEPFYSGLSETGPFFDVGDLTLALFRTDSGWNLWRTGDGFVWEDLGLLPWDGADPWSIGVAADDLVVGVDDTYWTTGDGADWAEITRQEWEEKTGSPPTPIDIPEPPDPAITPESEQELIATLFAEMSANTSLISENPEILQLLPGPEPRFDTTQLGREIEFEPLSLDDPFTEAVAGEAFQDPLPGPSGPTVLVGPVTPRDGWTFGQDPMLGKSYMLFWLTDSNGMCGGSVAGGGCRGAEALGMGSANAKAITDDDGLILAPLDTSVVVLRFNADTALWQRPTGGWAIFPTSVDGDDTYWVDAYDADGNVIATTEQR